MPSLWFCVPASGRAQLARICLKQLRRTCDALTENGIEATAVVIADDENLDTASELGFGTVERDNQFLSRKFNDGIQLAFDRPLPPRVREATHGEYRVTGRRAYRGNEPGTVFTARLDRNAEARAVMRGDIELLQRISPNLVDGSYAFPDGWDPKRAADYVVPCGSDDFVDHRIFLSLPESNTVLGFQHISFVREDGREMTSKHLKYPGGCGIRVYPRRMMAEVAFRPADEDRVRACDTSILTNLQAAATPHLEHAEIDPRQIVDWKTPGEQVTPYVALDRHRQEGEPVDPFDALADVYPEEALAEMAAHYGRVKPRLARSGHITVTTRRLRAPLSLERSK